MNASTVLSPAGSRHALVALLLSLLAGCGGGGGGGDPAPVVTPPAPQADYFPLPADGRWVYQGDTGDVVVRVAGTATIDGRATTVLQTLEGGVTQDEHYAKSATELLAVVAPTDEPLLRNIGSFQLLRLPLTPGNTWVQFDRDINGVVDVDSDGRNDRIQIRSEATVLGFETVTTPAGTFQNSAHVRTVVTQRVTLVAGNYTYNVTVTSDDWYAPDLGPVRNRLTFFDGVNTTVLDSLASGWRVNGQASETVAPTVISRSPAAGGTGAVQPLRLQFSEPMNTATSDAAALVVETSDGRTVSGQITWTSDRDLELIPDAPWASGSYSARTGTGMEDRLGNALATDRWSFTLDATGPGVVSATPAAGATGVALGAVIQLTFDEDLDPATVLPSSFQVSTGLAFTAVPVTAQLSGRVVTLTPLQKLDPSTTYEVGVLTYLRDRVGNPAGAFRWQFTTDAGFFALPQALAGIDSASVVEPGDMDGDGRNDLVVVASKSGTLSSPPGVYILRQKADGTHDTPLAVPLQNSCTPTSLTVGDIDRDGRLDIVVGSDSCGVEVLRNLGNNSFGNQTLFPVGAMPQLRLLDLDGSGVLAIVGIADSGLQFTPPSQLRIYRQTSAGIFGAAVDLASGLNSMSSFGAGDFNGDRRLDFVVLGRLVNGNPALLQLRQNPAGGFDSGPALNLPTPLESVGGLAVGDVTGDGLDDLVYTNNFDSSRSGLVVLAQVAVGGFGTGRTMATPPTPGIPRIADMDGDGRKDVVMRGVNSGNLSLFRQAADGSLGAVEVFKAGFGVTTPAQFVLADVDGDGRRDVVLGGNWLRNRSGLAAGTSAAGGVRAALRRASAVPENPR